MCYPYTRVPPLTLLHLAVSHPRSSMLVYISCMQFYGFLLLFEIRVVRVLFVKNVFRSRALCMCDYADTVKCLCLVFFFCWGYALFSALTKVLDSAGWLWITLLVIYVSHLTSAKYALVRICTQQRGKAQGKTLSTNVKLTRNATTVEQRKKTNAHTNTFDRVVEQNVLACSSSSTLVSILKQDFLHCFPSSLAHPLSALNLSACLWFSIRV